MSLPSMPADVGSDTSAVRLEMPAVALQIPVAAKAVTVAPRQRIAFLDAAKGIGILLVVMGHCLGGLHDAGMIADRSVAWLGFYVIYTFHMPLFFFLSGSLVHARIVSQPVRFLRSSLTRIVYPYFLWGTIQSLVLLVASGVINHPVRVGVGPLLLRILWEPPGQFWFLYVLFLAHMVALIMLPLGGRSLLALAFAVIYAAAAISPAFSHLISSYVSGGSLLAYIVGVCFGEMVAGWRGRIERPQVWILLGFVLFLAAAWTGWREQADAYSYVTLPAACAGCIVALLLAHTKLLCCSRWLIHLGQRSMPIYVLHVLFVAGTRIVLQKNLHISDVAVVLPVIFVTGVVGPLLLDQITRMLHIQPALGLA